MPYTVNDQDFSEMMVEIKASNRIGDAMLKRLDWMDQLFYLLVFFECVFMVLMFLEWRYPNLIKKWFSPAEQEKAPPAVSNVV